MRARHKFMENFNFQGGTRTKILFPPPQRGTIWPSHKEKGPYKDKKAPPYREKENLNCFPERDERLLLPSSPWGPMYMLLLLY